MVQKKSPFVQIDKSNITTYLSKLKEDAKPKWGIMTAQHMVEHLENTVRIGAGEIQDFDIATPEEHLEKVQEMVYNHKPMPRGHKHPLMKQGELEKLIHPDLDTAKAKLIEALDNLDAYFKENPDTKTKNAVFGELNKFEWDLLNVKHLNHHFEQFNLLD